MIKTDIVVVGGSAAGITAAITCRRHYSEKKVLLIRREQKVPIPCAIPYVFGSLNNPDKNLFEDDVFEKNGIDLLIDEVTDIERIARVVITAGGERIIYKKLVLATGSIAVIPPIPGVNLKNIYVVKKDLSYLRQMLDQLNRSSNLVIVGGGYIGSEFADECRKNRNLKITIIEMQPHCLMLTLDGDFCAAAESIEKEHGIEILAPENVEAFLGNDAVKSVRLAIDRELEADMVIIDVGCAANTELAEKAGLELGPTKAIKVNRYMQTGDQNIFACGDCVEKVSFFDGQPCNLKLASIATREARIAAANLYGNRRMNYGVIGVFSTVLGETAFALAGLSEREAREKGYDVVIGEAAAPNRHPDDMPETGNLRVRLVFERSTGIILGGQIMGDKCCGELINTVSACIHQRMTVDDIAIFAMGTHPALTASPIAYQLTDAAEMAIKSMR